MMELEAGDCGVKSGSGYRLKSHEEYSIKSYLIQGHKNVIKYQKGIKRTNNKPDVAAIRNCQAIKCKTELEAGETEGMRVKSNSVEAESMRLKSLYECSVKSYPTRQ